MIKTVEFLLIIRKAILLTFFAKVGDHILFEDCTIGKITSLDKMGWPEIDERGVDVYDIKRLIRGSLKGYKKEIYEGIIQCRDTLKELSDWDEDDI